MTDPSGSALAYLILTTASSVIEEIHNGVRARGFDDIRPAHGYAFARLAPHGATVTDLAEHLSVTKQAASQLADELVKKGYVVRSRHPTDARARLLELTERGWAATRAADEVTAKVVDEWTKLLGPQRIGELTADLSALSRSNRLRPIW